MAGEYEYREGYVTIVACVTSQIDGEVTFTPPTVYIGGNEIKLTVALIMRSSSCCERFVEKVRLNGMISTKLDIPIIVL
jgi:hypothetical protein